LSSSRHITFATFVRIFLLTNVRKCRERKYIRTFFQIEKVVVMAGDFRGNIKLAEEQLQMQSLLLDHVQDALIVRDLEDRIRFWNKGAERVYGWRTEEVTGENVYDFLFPPDIRDPDAKADVFAERGEWTGELRQLTKTRELIIVESLWKLQRDDDGRPKSVLMISRDITQRKTLERELLRVQRMETAGRLATSVAHDLNNALSAMLISLRVVLEEQMDPKDRNTFRVSQACAEHAARLIMQLLAFAKGIEEQPTSIDLGSLISGTERILRSTFPNSIKIKVMIPPERCTIAGSTTQLHQMLLNLCLNARDAMPSGGTVSIEASNVVLDTTAISRWPAAIPGKYVAVTVADTGHGIPNDLTGKIFEPFFTTKKHDRGTGLGLSTVATIVRNHNGFIDLATELNRGTQFRIYLPVEKSRHN
jgi:PAS domain S-box-containing protein